MQGVAGNKLGFAKLVEAELKLFLLQVDHGREIEVLAELLRRLLKLMVLHAVEFLLYADDLLHDLNAFVVFAAFCQDIAFAVELAQLIAQH